jgi:hypothetical protein
METVAGVRHRNKLFRGGGGMIPGRVPELGALRRQSCFHVFGASSGFMASWCVVALCRHGNPGYCRDQSGSSSSRSRRHAPRDAQSPRPCPSRTLLSGPKGRRVGADPEDRRAVAQTVGVRIHRKWARTKNGRSSVTPVLTHALIILPSFSKFQYITEIWQNSPPATGYIE